MHNFQELIIWQKAMDITEGVYRLELVPEEKVDPILDDLVELQKINYSLIKKFKK